MLRWIGKKAVRSLKGRPAIRSISRATKTPFNSLIAAEQPVPIVFVCGEGLNSRSFAGYAEILSKRGFSGFIFEPPGQAVSVQEVSESLQAEIQASGMTPPILISHSFSSFVCQDFLESNAALGLMMINPVEPNPSLFLRRIASCGVYKSTAVSREHYLKHHYMSDVPDSYFRKFTQIQSNSIVLESKLPCYLTSLLSHSVAIPEIKLEPRSVQMLVVYTNVDGVGDLTSRMVDKFYELDPSEIVVLNINTRAPMLKSVDLLHLHESVYPWIESLTY